MLRFLAKRLIGLVATILGMTMIIFVLQDIVPSDPGRAAVGPNAPESVVLMKREELGLNEPLPVRYGRYLARLAHADLGESVQTRNPVASDLRRFAPATAELMVFALCLGGALGCLLGVSSTIMRRSGSIRLLFLAAGSVPIFLTALLLSLLFWFELGWLPFGGRASVRPLPDGPTGFLTLDGAIAGRADVVASAIVHMILPALCLALPIAVAVGRSLQASLLMVMRQNYIRTAFAQGLPRWQVVGRHALRNALNAPLSMIALQFGLLFANVLIVEQIFAWPGLGLYTVQAFANTDLPAVLGVALTFGTVYVLVNVVVDLLQAVADPRIALN